MNTVINALQKGAKERVEIAKRRRYCVLAILILFPLFAVILQDWLNAALFIALLMLAAVSLLERYCRVLDARSIMPEKSNWHIEWCVDVNHVWVGCITDAEYATLRYRAFHDRGLFLAQALNIYQIVLHAVGTSCVVFPVAMFWGVLAFAYFSPDTFVATVADIQTLLVSDTPGAAQVIGGMFVSTLMLNIVALTVFRPSLLGFVNHFDKAISADVRKHCRIAARGEVELWRITPDGVVFSDEIATLRQAK